MSTTFALFVTRNAPLRQRAQRGVSLLFALLSLAAISLAAVALVRSVDSGTLVIGNLGFKQDATSASDRATEAARLWLMTSGADLTADSAGGIGYYASSQDNLDPTGRLTSAANRMAVVNWGDTDSCACLPATCSSCSRLPSNEIPITVNSAVIARARYLITRICPVPGAVSDTNACAQPPANAMSDGKARNTTSYADPKGGPPSESQIPYYRIIVRTVSGRNTVSFTETVLY